MTESSFLLPYGIGMLGLLIWFARRVFRKPISFRFDDVRDAAGQLLPGNLFQFLHDLEASASDPACFEFVVDRSIKRLRPIADNALQCLGFANTRPETLSNGREVLVTIIENVAVCFGTFLLQVKGDKNPTRLNVEKYRTAVDEIVAAFNACYSGKITLFELSQRITRSKREIYLSWILTSLMPDQSTTERFRQRFIESAALIKNKETLELYLSRLEAEWIAKPEELGKIDAKFIIPLFTVRNILHYCVKKWKQDGKIIADKLEPELRTEQLDAIAYRGITFRKAIIIEISKQALKAYSGQPIPPYKYSAVGK
jgi:hypothetical protein